MNRGIGKESKNFKESVIALGLIYYCACDIPLM